MKPLRLLPLKAAVWILSPGIVSLLSSCAGHKAENSPAQPENPQAVPPEDTAANRLRERQTQQQQQEGLLHVPEIKLSQAELAKLPRWQDPLPDSSNKLLKIAEASLPFSIRVPPEYILEQGLAKEVQMFIWREKPRADQTIASFMVVAIPAPASGKKQDSAEACLNAAMLGFRKEHRQKWRQAPNEWGWINNHLFIRSAWQGQNADGRMMEGWCYVTKYKEKILIISAQDFSQYAPNSLSKARAALLSLEITQAS